MSNELEYLSHRVAAGRLTRRDFLGRAAALGVTATVANSMIASAVMAAGPVKGGTLKAGLQGGESTNVLDPALDLTQVNFNFSKCWGEMLVDINPDGSIDYHIAESIGSNDDATVWTMKIRKDVEFHSGKPVTADDVIATLERHGDKKSKSAALGILQGIDTMKANGDEVVVTLKGANAD